MPKKGYKQSDEQKQKRGEALKGKTGHQKRLGMKHSLKTKQLMSEKAFLRKNSLAQRYNNFVKPALGETHCIHGQWRYNCAKCRPDADKKRKLYRLKRVGLTETTYLELFASQDNKCAICDRNLEPFTKDAHVDHCHVTGAVRGILCRGCNCGIGQLGDSYERVKRATDYLHSHLHKENKQQCDESVHGSQ